MHRQYMAVNLKNLSILFEFNKCVKHNFIYCLLIIKQRSLFMIYWAHQERKPETINFSFKLKSNVDLFTDFVYTLNGLPLVIDL